jgi:hypothetical protein
MRADGGIPLARQREQREAGDCCERYAEEREPAGDSQDCGRPDVDPCVGDVGGEEDERRYVRCRAVSVAYRRYAGARLRTGLTRPSCATLATIVPLRVKK